MERWENEGGEVLIPVHHELNQTASLGKTVENNTAPESLSTGPKKRGENRQNGRDKSEVTKDRGRTGI